MNMLEIPHHIAGQAVFSEHTFPLYNPATGEQIGTVSEASAAHVDDAVDAARAALNGPWRAMPAEARWALVERLANAIDDRAEAFVAAEVSDTGKPISFARAVDVPRGAGNLRAFAHFARSAAGQSFEQHTADGRGALHYTIRRPVGVIAVVCPWNLPLLLMTWKLGPALACGNTVVVKPSELTPQTAHMLAELATEIGFPPGVFNVVHGHGANAAGAFLTTHPGIDAITFTGETKTGSTIMRAAAPGIKSVSFELGGKNPSIVFADADLDAAVAGTIRSAFSNCGQVCLCSERVYVERSIFDAFVARVAEGAKAMTIGDPMAPTTEMGALISADHRAKVLGYFDLARDEGATFVAGGGSIDRPGYFVQPSVMIGLDDSARAMREEIFGPVCHIAPFDDEDEAIARANDTDYGLCAAIWTQNLARAHRVAAQVDVGLAWVNTWFLRDLRTPFGGVKLSGIGREGGHHSLEFYSEQRNVCIKL